MALPSLEPQRCSACGALPPWHYGFGPCRGDVVMQRVRKHVSVNEVGRRQDVEQVDAAKASAGDEEQSAGLHDGTAQYLSTNGAGVQ